MVSLLNRYFVVGIFAQTLAATAFGQFAPDAPFGKKLYAQKPDELPAHGLCRLGEPRMWQPGGVACIAVSPDGRWMATGDRASFCRVYLWDLKAGKGHRILHGHHNWPARIEFSADSEYLLVSHHDEPIHRQSTELVVWKVETGNLVKHHGASDWSLARDGKTLAVARPRPHSDPMRPLLAAYKGFAVELLDFPSHKSRRAIVHATKHIQALALSPDGALVAAGTSKEILLWDATTGKELPGIAGLKETVHLLHFSPDGKTLASVSDDLPANTPRFVELWDVKTRKNIGTLHAPEKGWPFRRLEFLPNGSLLTHRFEGEYQLWNLETKKAVWSFKGHAIAIFADGKSLAHTQERPSGWWGPIQFVEIATGKPLPTKGGVDPLRPWKFSDDGKIVYTRVKQDADGPELVQAWDTASGKEIIEKRATQKIVEPPTLVQKPKIDLGNGRELRWSNQFFRVFDTKAGRELFSHQGFVYGLSPDKQKFALQSSEVQGESVLMQVRIRIIDLTTFKDVASIPFPDSLSRTLAQLVFSPDGKTLAVQDYQNMTRFYDAASGKLQVERQGLGEFIFAPDGRLLATTNLVGTVDLIDLTGAKQKACE